MFDEMTIEELYRLQDQTNEKIKMLERLRSEVAQEIVKKCSPDTDSR